MDYSRSVREARDLPQHPGEDVKTFRIAREGAAMQPTTRVVAYYDESPSRARAVSLPVCENPVV